MFRGCEGLRSGSLWGGSTQPKERDHDGTQKNQASEVWLGSLEA